VFDAHALLAAAVAAVRAGNLSASLFHDDSHFGAALNKGANAPFSGARRSVRVTPLHKHHFTLF
jgi:hypothetical protein